MPYSHTLLRSTIATRYHLCVVLDVSYLLTSTSWSGACVPYCHTACDSMSGYLLSVCRSLSHTTSSLRATCCSVMWW